MVAYTPVVGAAALGLHQTDLSQQPAYSQYIGKPFSLKSSEQHIWHLKKFEGGRYYIEPTAPGTDKPVVCHLEGSEVLISKIFYDSPNDGTFFSARVTCDGQVYDAPLNRFSESFTRAVEFRV